jgi:hypothetical protein
VIVRQDEDNLTPGEMHTLSVSLSSEERVRNNLSGGPGGPDSGFSSPLTGDCLLRATRQRLKRSALILVADGAFLVE